MYQKSEQRQTVRELWEEIRSESGYEDADSDDFYDDDDADCVCLSD